MGSPQSVHAKPGQLFTTRRAGYFILGYVEKVTSRGRVASYALADEQAIDGHPGMLWLLPAGISDAMWAAWLARPQPRHFNTLAEITCWATGFVAGGSHNATDQIEELRKLLPRLVRLWDRSSKYGAPDHGHDVPGVWDADNNDEMAGKPCEECAIYDKVRLIAVRLAKSA